jgi:serine/threonine protein kinase
MGSRRKPGLRLDVTNTEERISYVDILSKFGQLNKLKFPNNPIVYNFNLDEMIQLRTLSEHDNSNSLIVQKFQHKPTNMKLAIKFVRIPDFDRMNEIERDKAMKRFEVEINAHLLLANSPNIVNFYGFALFEGRLLIAIELMKMSLGDLQKRFLDMEQTFPGQLLEHIIVNIVDALCECQAAKIMHRDIKPDNILINRKGEIKLCDFGISKKFDTSSLATTVIGTCAYLPPERIKEIGQDGSIKYDSRSDVWSLGITLAELALGRLPYLKESQQSPSFFTVLTAIKDANADEIVERCLRNNYSNELCEFIKLCLQEIESRPTFTQLKETQFYDEMSKNVKTEYINDLLVSLKVKSFKRFLDFKKEPGHRALKGLSQNFFCVFRFNFFRFFSIFLIYFFRIFFDFSIFFEFFLKFFDFFHFFSNFFQINRIFSKKNIY